MKEKEGSGKEEVAVVFGWVSLIRKLEDILQTSLASH